MNRYSLSFTPFVSNATSSLPPGVESKSDVSDNIY